VRQQGGGLGQTSFRFCFNLSIRIIKLFYLEIFAHYFYFIIIFHLLPKARGHLEILALVNFWKKKSKMTSLAERSFYRFAPSNYLLIPFIDHKKFECHKKKQLKSEIFSIGCEKINF
jgi:hypothetical protein